MGVKYYKDINIRMIPQPSYEFKFVLVGDSSVGKSSVLARFVDDQFHDNLLATIGVDFKFRRIQVDAEEVKIQIWDTAGRELLINRTRNIQVTRQRLLSQCRCHFGRL